MTRSPVCSPLLGCACRRRRPGWSTSTTGSTSWAFTSSAGSRRGPPGSTSTPIPRRRRWPPSWERCGRSRPLTARERHPSLTVLLVQLNRAVRGWCNYFRYGVSKATFSYLDQYIWRRVSRWLLKRHDGINWKTLYRRYLTGRPGHLPAEGKVVLFRASTVPVIRYRWRGHSISTPWTSESAANTA